MKRIVHLAVYNTLADWETGYATAHVRGEHYDIVTVAETTDPVTTMGGTRILPDITLDQLSPADSAMLILPGADLWDEGGNGAFAKKAAEFLAAGVPVAAICGAVPGLAREGLLDDRDHTSAFPGYVQVDGYNGADHYVEADAVTDGDLITAGPTEPVAFAREVLARLDVFPPHKLDAWFRLFKHSDASAIEVLMAP
ncbi:type 1 glutamine amidotransferase family protein [Nonomuraea sp. NPDC059194]|uniref:type 1 glutamine amidotransferase family protein n=1 Tax=Nonomuraea sp. NPDC059194 TaxID=3346764 RepID=UPI00369E1DB3